MLADPIYVNFDTAAVKYTFTAQMCCEWRNPHILPSSFKAYCFTSNVGMRAGPHLVKDTNILPMYCFSLKATAEIFGKAKISDINLSRNSFTAIVIKGGLIIYTKKNNYSWCVRSIIEHSC